MRWALCHVRANWDPGRTQSSYELSVSGTDADTHESLVIENVHGHSARVDTGGAVFELSGQKGFELRVSDARGALPWTSVRLRLVTERHTALADIVERVTIERQGSFQATVEVRGRFVGVSGLSYVIGIQFFHALNAIRMELAVRNSRRAVHRGGFWDLGDKGSVRLREVAIVTAFEGSVSDIQCSPSPGARPRTYAAPFEIYQESSGGRRWNSPTHRNREGVVPLTFAGYRIKDRDRTETGSRATPVVVATIDGRMLSATVPGFWQEFPKSISISRSHMTVGLWPASFPDLHELQGGEQKTHALCLGFGPDPVTDMPLDWCRDPLLVRVSPEHFSATEAFPYIAPATADPDQRYYSLVSTAVEGPSSFEEKREVVDEYGWRNFGDVYADHEAVRHTGEQPFVSHYNNQYDAVAGLLCQYMRTGDSRWWTLGDELARHVVDIDIYHTRDDKPGYNGGMFWHTNHYVDAETSTHRCYSRRSSRAGGGPSGEQNYTTGLLMHYLMTGRVASREAVLGLAGWVIKMDDGRLTPFRWLTKSATGLASMTASASFHGPGRGAGNSINALLDAHRLTSEDRWLIKAEELLRRCIHPDDDAAARELLDAERRWSYTVFLQVLGKYLDYKALLGAYDQMFAYAQASLLRYARWMAEHESPYLQHPERLEFPTETWVAQDMRKSEVFRFAARHCAGAERERFQERSRFFYEYSLSTLQTFSSRRCARPVVILLTNGYAHGRLAGPFTIDTPRAVPQSFPPPERFVPQKAVALTRARRLTLVGCGLLGLTLLLLLI